jgi:hypothetical protein
MAARTLQEVAGDGALSFAGGRLLDRQDQVRQVPARRRGRLAAGGGAGEPGGRAGGRGREGGAVRAVHLCGGLRERTAVLQLAGQAVGQGDRPGRGDGHHRPGNRGDHGQAVRPGQGPGGGRGGRRAHAVGHHRHGGRRHRQARARGGRDRAAAGQRGHRLRGDLCVRLVRRDHRVRQHPAQVHGPHHPRRRHCGRDGHAGRREGAGARPGRSGALAGRPHLRTRGRPEAHGGRHRERQPGHHHHHRAREARRQVHRGEPRAAAAPGRHRAGRRPARRGGGQRAAAGQGGLRGRRHGAHHAEARDRADQQGVRPQDRRRDPPGHGRRRAPRHLRGAQPHGPGAADAAPTPWCRRATWCRSSAPSRT